MDWTSEQVKLLVNEYKKRPVLWDSGHNEYRVATAKYDAYLEIADTFQCQITDIRKKLYSIFGSYRREKCKVRQGSPTNWYLYKDLSFLKGHLEAAGAEDSSQSNPNYVHSPDELYVDPAMSDEEDAEEDADNHSFVIKKEPPETSETHEPIETYIVDTSRSHGEMNRHTKPAKRAAEQSTGVTERAIKKCKAAQRDRGELKERDECDGFGEYIAMSLRKHDARTQAMIKQAINNIIFEQEMKVYSRHQHSADVENPLSGHSGQHGQH